MTHNDVQQDNGSNITNPNLIKSIESEKKYEFNREDTCWVNDKTLSVLSENSTEYCFLSPFWRLVLCNI